LTLPLPPHPAPNVHDDRETPLSRDGTIRVLDLIWVRREENYFCKWDWTGTSVICPSGKLLAAAASSSSTVGLLPMRGCSQFHGKKRKGDGRKERPFREFAGNEAFPRRKHEER
jgi:hypothetical protein